MPSGAYRALQAAADEGDLFGYLAPEGWLDDLLEELESEPLEVVGRLVLARGPLCQPAWVADRWLTPRPVAFDSIRDAARKLRGLQRGWAPYSARLHRRTALIEQALPHVSARPLRFPEPPPAAPLGAFTLLDPHTLIASPACDSPVPRGEYRFVEDRQGPPSRAYLKLWEALTRMGEHPASGDRCLDLGASPGGFTWVCQQLGAGVVAVDKAPLDPSVAEREGVRFVRASAFSLRPEEWGPVDWLLSDVACYPQRLLRLVRTWAVPATAGGAERIVTTIKLKGETERETVRAFQQIPGGRVVHLAHNKHELTFLYRRPPEAEC